MNEFLSETSPIHLDNVKQPQNSDVGPWDAQENNPSPRVKLKSQSKNCQSLPTIKKPFTRERKAENSASHSKRMAQQALPEFIPDTSFKLDSQHQKHPILRKSLSITGQQAKYQKFAYKNSIIFRNNKSTILSAPKKQESHIRTVPNILQKKESHNEHKMILKIPYPVNFLHGKQMNSLEFALQNDSKSQMNTKRENSCQTTFIQLPSISVDKMNAKIQKQIGTPNYQKLIQKAMARKKMGADHLLFELMRDFHRVSKKIQPFSNPLFEDKL